MHCQTDASFGWGVGERISSWGGRRCIDAFGEGGKRTMQFDGHKTGLKEFVRFLWENAIQGMEKDLIPYVYRGVIQEKCGDRWKDEFSRNRDWILIFIIT